LRKRHPQMRTEPPLLEYPLPPVSLGFCPSYPFNIKNSSTETINEQLTEVMMQPMGRQFRVGSWVCLSLAGRMIEEGSS
jgi:hypothetical protein